MKKRRKSKKRSIKSGAIPGQLVHVGDSSDSTVTIELIQFDKTDVIEKKITELHQIGEYFKSDKVDWLNVDGVHDPQVIESIGENLKIDSLVLEDIMNTDQRPKVEEFEGYSFVVLKMLSYNKEAAEVESEQLSFILTNHHVISFQERKGDVFDPIRNRIRNALGKVRDKPVDYLAFLLIDIIIDNYFLIIEALGDQLDDLEERVLSQPKEEHVQEIQLFKRQLLTVRRAVYPLREMLSFFIKGESNVVREEHLKYYRDAYDHSLSVMDSIESYIDMIGSIRDLYMTSISHKMNQIMKVLTIMASLFIPLTFIVGIYGMNFENMPELGYEYGYFVVWGVMILVTIGMIIYFRRKNWF